MAFQLNLAKSAETLRLNLTKLSDAGKLPEAEVCFNLDVSGSYVDMHYSGVTTTLLARLIPWGMVFDPDKKLDVYTFSEGPAHYVGEITEDNHSGYIHRHIIKKVPNWDGGTSYAPVLRANLERFGWISLGNNSRPIQQSLWQRLFRKNEQPAVMPALPPKRKSIILFNTDGENSDQDTTARLLRKMQLEGYQVYVQFIAVQQPRSDFSFLTRMAQEFNNCGLVIIQDIDRWVELPDEAINEQIITEEFVAWMNQ